MMARDCREGDDGTLELLRLCAVISAPSAVPRACTAGTGAGARM
jgi:hypothetical protein